MGYSAVTLKKVLTRTNSGIVIFSITIVVLVITAGYHSNSVLGEKPAVCDPEDKSVNSTESKICGVPTTNENATNTTVGKAIKP